MSEIYKVKQDLKVVLRHNASSCFQYAITVGVTSSVHKFYAFRDVVLCSLLDIVPVDTAKPSW